jgi:hypothetical protein
MKLWNGIVTSGLAGAMILCLFAGRADAAPKKRTVAIKAAGSFDSSKQYLSGTNLDGRSGLFYGDTSEVARDGQIEGSAHLTFQSIGYYNVSQSVFTIPAGAHFGIAPDFELSAGAELSIFSYPSYRIGPWDFGGGSSTNVIVFGGGKYRFAGDREMPDFSFGGTIRIPTSGGSIVVMPEGTVTYVLNNGLLLNGDIGVGISNTTYVKADVGAGYPISPQVTGIAEIGANQIAYTGSVFAFGIRAAVSEFKLQGLVGVPLTGGGVIIGGGIILGTK